MLSTLDHVTTPQGVLTYPQVKVSQPLCVLMLLKPCSGSASPLGLSQFSTKY